MLIKPETSGTNPPSAAVSTTSACGNCAIEERRLLHHVRHRGIFRRLCTSCVLRLHPQSLCPTCFQVYPPSPTNDAALTCFKCYSSSHSRCVEAAAGPTSPPNPYICPLCTHPNSPIFKLKPAKDLDPTNSGGDNCRVMDRDAARKLLAAAKIASASMNKAAAASKAEAERRAKEAAYTKKKAKESLEYVAHLVTKIRKKEIEGGGPGIQPVGCRNGIGANVLSGRPVNGSNQVLAALNAVGLKENGNVGLGADRVPMDVDENNEGGVSGEENVDISDDDVDLVRALEEQMQQDDGDEEENSHSGEQDANGAEI
ncbi:hypothetical protein CASFOL_004427 [Castilleja foliolosa]|uniref:Uncharacterized protein n=1 Tax=Castilleja foliolosa TaxID=1961234 RepID=A0ABD3EAG3_9LAMI